MATAALLIAMAPLMLITAFFSIEVAVGLAGRGSRSAVLTASPSAVIVIPAHDEARIIGRALGQIKAAISENMRILVVADNCSDTTAICARLSSVGVIERTDSARRGKGYALAFAVERLKSLPPDVLVVLDADCTIDRESLRALVSAAAEFGRPCQAINLLRPDLTAAPLVQISAFAFMLKNQVRQCGLERLSGRVHLAGTGMAIPYRLLSSSLLASNDIVEDLSLGLELSDRGYPPKLVSNALVVSSAESPVGTLVQRSRWEGGFLSLSLRRAPRMMARALRECDFLSFFAALDLMVPPLALLALINIGALLCLVSIVGLLGLGWTPIILDGLLLILAAGAVLVVWATHGRNFVSLRVLIRVPAYIAWKIPLYLALARRGAPRQWLRGRR